jgi:hypothetical protein
MWIEEGKVWRREEGKERRMEGRDRGGDEINIMRKREILRGREEGGNK